jgi:RNA polymerase sigma factor (sigma-70 family)
MGVASLPTLRGIREGDGDAAAAAGEIWRRDRIEAFALLNDTRLLGSYRLATLILRDRDEAEDATQEAIEKAWLAWRTLRDRDRFDAWFDRILVNVCRNRMRRRRIIPMVTLDDAYHVESPDSHSSSVARLALEPAFARLSPDQRIVIVLRFYRDLPIDEIAERLGIPAGTAKSRLHYALGALRRAIESTEEAPR